MSTLERFVAVVPFHLLCFLVGGELSFVSKKKTLRFAFILSSFFFFFVQDA